MDDDLSQPDYLRSECGTCVFFKANLGQKRVLTGVCRRFPPQVTRFWSDNDVVEEYAWPQVTRIMWCGEFASVLPEDADDILM